VRSAGSSISGITRKIGVGSAASVRRTTGAALRWSRMSENGTYPSQRAALAATSCSHSQFSRLFTYGWPLGSTVLPSKA
jgi:hypothetical protein